MLCANLSSDVSKEQERMKCDMFCFFVDIARGCVTIYEKLTHMVILFTDQTLYSSIPLKSFTIQSTELHILLISTV